MQPDQFNKLQFGNVIKDGGGQKFIVTQVIRDPKTDAVKHIGLVRALGPEHASSFEVVDTTSTQTMLIGRSV